VIQRHLLVGQKLQPKTPYLHAKSSTSGLANALSIACYKPLSVADRVEEAAQAAQAAQAARDRLLYRRFARKIRRVR